MRVYEKYKLSFVHNGFWYLGEAPDSWIFLGICMGNGLFGSTEYMGYFGLHRKSAYDGKFILPQVLGAPPPIPTLGEGICPGCPHNLGLCESKTEYGM